MSRLPCPEEHEMAGFTVTHPKAASYGPSVASEAVSPLEGLLMYYGRFVNEMSVRGDKTPIEKAFLQAGQRFFQELADNCAKLAKDDRAANVEGLEGVGLEGVGLARPDILELATEEDYELESAGGSSLAEQRATTKKKTAKRKSPTRATKKK